MLSPGWSMGGAINRAPKEKAPRPALEAYLLSLEAVGLPLHQILPLAEEEGLTAPELVALAEGFLQRVALVDSPADAAALVFGCVRCWEALLPQVSAQGAALLEALLMGRPGRLESLATLRDGPFFNTFRTRVLRRLGYPTCLAQSHRLKVHSPRHLRRVMAWLGSGGPVLAYELELRGFQASSPRWGALHAPFLELRNGLGPESLEWNAEPTDPTFWNRLPKLQVQAVKGLRQVRGGSHGGITLLDCPDLESLGGPCRNLKAVDCPSLQSVWIGTRSKQLSLQRCRQLRSVRAWAEEYPGNPSFGSEWIFEPEALEILDCPRFHHLPARLHVKGRLQLQGVGPIEDWPWDFLIGGDFLVSDCPDLELLPALEVQGSLIVTGPSGLRRLSSGTVIGKNLDLRACTRLEDIPRGVKVGGYIYLPVHLNQRREEVTPRLLEAARPPTMRTRQHLTTECCRVRGHWVAASALSYPPWTTAARRGRPRRCGVASLSA